MKPGDYVYYEDYFGFRQVGEVIWVGENGEFSVSTNPRTSMPQMDDSYRRLSLSDEGKYFWLHPTPDCPIPIDAQMKMQNNIKR